MPSFTSPSNYPWVNAPTRFDRVVRRLIVVAVALLIGATAGGVTVFALVSALTTEPQRDMSAGTNKDAEEGGSTGAVVTALPAPAPAEPPKLPNPSTGAPTMAPAQTNEATGAQTLRQPAAAPASANPEIGTNQTRSDGREHPQHKRLARRPNRSIARSDFAATQPVRDAETANGRPTLPVRDATPAADRDLADSRTEEGGRPSWDLFGGDRFRGGEVANDMSEVGPPRRSELQQPLREHSPTGRESSRQRRAMVLPAQPPYTDKRRDRFFGLFDD